ncbi:pentatricopeptide repeat-containing protein, chloroplastic [Trifolium repens]|nr:pentatricopeptide repeat-containing protein, chloroplastic [Trifolium repens]
MVHTYPLCSLIPSTFHNRKGCAILCSMHHIRLYAMPLFECEPNDNMSASVISSYECIGNVDMALRLYRRAKKEKWKVEKMALSSLIKMYGKSTNYDGCLSVYHDMEVFGVKL